MTAPDHDAGEAPRKGPDLTEPVMRRLGLASVDAVEAKRRRRRRAILRVAMCVVAAAAGGGIVMLLSSQPQPAAPTIPSAIRHDLQQHGHTIDRTVRSIRGLGQQLPTLPAPTAEPGDRPGTDPGEPAAEPSV